MKYIGHIFLNKFVLTEMFCFHTQRITRVALFYESLFTLKWNHKWTDASVSGLRWTTLALVTVSILTSRGKRRREKKGSIVTEELTTMHFWCFQSD